MGKVWLTRWNNPSMTYCHARMFNPYMVYYRDRVLSFEKWPLQLKQNKHSMAQAGFYYTKNSDIVTCFSCGICISQWLKSDEAWAEHQRWSPNCHYLKMVGFKETAYNCLETFV